MTASLRLHTALTLAGLVTAIFALASCKPKPPPATPSTTPEPPVAAPPPPTAVTKPDAFVRPQPAPSFPDRHVFFKNSPADGGHAYSASNVIAPSILDTSPGRRFPVDYDRYASPPNSLRLKWRSASGGDWQMTLTIPRYYARTFRFEGDSVTLRLYADFEITTDNSPYVYLRDDRNHGTRARLLVDDGVTIPANQWTLITLPIASFDIPRYAPDARTTHDPQFTAANLVSITFMQGLDDDKERTLWIDDIIVRDAVTPKPVTLPAPTALTARAYERHIDLAWQAPEAGTEIITYVIHRSDDDGKTFTPVATQNAVFTRYTDYLGKLNRTAQYRVSAMDLYGNESAVSNSIAATTSPRAYTDDELFTMVQEATFRYYWDNAHPVAGLAPEVMPGDRNLIALGGSGFGVMAIITAADRGFITREQAAARLQKIVRFLAKADRYRGVWPHFLDGNTGKIIPLFGKYDNGGDLVETAFMIQGLLAARQYFNANNAVEKEIRDTATQLWHEVEWDWYRKTKDSPVLYWHWSPNYGFHISHPLIGWNETLIVYLLAIASPTHPVPAELWHTGWAGTAPLNVLYRQSWSRTTQGDHFTNGNTYYGIKLEAGSGNGSDLFFTHFSFLGFDPRGIRDRYTNYYKNNRAIALIDHAYCSDNPRSFVGYGANCWGLSAGINSGGGRPLPRDDNGTINIMASLASMPYTPDESLAALKHFYRDLGGKTWGIFGFHDGFNATQNWWEEVYMALNQAPITVMIENHRTGLIWKQFMANQEIHTALDAIGFKPDPQK